MPNLIAIHVWPADNQKALGDGRLLTQNVFRVSYHIAIYGLPTEGTLEGTCLFQSTFSSVAVIASALANSHAGDRNSLQAFLFKKHTSNKRH